MLLVENATELSQFPSKKVLLYMAKVDRGGIENLFLNIIPILGEDYDFCVAYYGEGENELGDEFEKLGCHLHKLNANRYFHPIKFIREIQAFIRDKGIDVLHTNVGYSTFYALIAAHLEKVPVRIAHSHGSEFGDSKNPLNGVFSLLCKLSCLFFASTRINVGELSARGLFFKRNSSLFVPNGVDLCRFGYSPEARLAVREKLNIPKDASVLISVGRLEEVKNHSFLLKVFFEYLTMHSDSYLLIVGTGSLKEDIELEANELRIDERVLLVGGVDDPESYYAAADFMVNPSLHEGLSLAMIEAQASGLVCFTSTNVDSGTKITDDFHFLPLDMGYAGWARAIADQDIPTHREDIDSRLQAYDISNTAATLKKIYDREII